MPEGTARFAHLSDIHFQQRVGGDVWDLDADLRNELERDLRGVVERGGALRGVLVTGDIAFSGESGQYDQAGDWLARICEIGGCREQDVWLVPGNHDVDREVVTGSQTLQDFHALLRDCPVDQIDGKLYQYLVADGAGGDAQLEPLRNYISFATRYECSISSSRPYWESAIEVAGTGYQLRLRGMTSPLISDDRDDTDAHKLVLGSAQATILRATNTVTVTLAHHPPSWLRDGEQVDELLRTRAQIQLWGHRHTQRARVLDDNVHLFAGAVHPARGELAWEPRYNVIDVAINPERGDCVVTLDARVWRPQESCFGADFGIDGEATREFTMVLAALAEPGPVAEDLGMAPEPILGAEPVRDARRQLAFAFSSLPYQKRLEVARELNLLDEATRDVSDQDLFELVLSRAVHETRLRDLWVAVQAQRGRPADPNPFEGNG